MRAPLHEQTVADPAEQTRHKHPVRVANSATIIVMGNIQPLMEAVFDAAKTGPVKFQPLLGVELGRWGAGEKSDLLVLAALGLAEQTGRLPHQWKANLLRGGGLGPDGAADYQALFEVQSAELGGRRLPRGGNPPWGRGAASQ